MHLTISMNTMSFRGKSVIFQGGSKMINHLQKRIYPSRKYIMTPLNTPNFEEKKKIAEIIFSEKYENVDSILNYNYDQMRTVLSNQNVVCMGKPNQPDEICMYVFEVKFNESFKFGGFDESGVPYLEMLN